MASIAERRQLKVSHISAKGGHVITSDPDSFSLPVYVANAIVFFSAVYYLVLQWREKIRNSSPVHILNISQIWALLIFLASFIYLLTFIVPGSEILDDEEETIEDFDDQQKLKATAASKYKLIMDNEWLWSDEEMVKSGKIPESKLQGDCGRAAAIRREELHRRNYEAILSEMPVGYVHTPVGIAGPLLLDGADYLRKLLFR